MLVMLGALAAVGALGYAYATRETPARANATNASVPSVPSARSTAAQPPAAVTPVEADDEAPAVSAANIGRWVSDTTSPDPQIRANAIVALAQAPKSQALPALARVLESGDPEVDRQIALRSLHSLALEHGDEDNAIRSILRDAIYHGDDEQVNQSAQAVLDDIEAAMAEGNEADSG
jgi:hypothetical protein